MIVIAWARTEGIDLASMTNTTPTQVWLRRAKWLASRDVSTPDHVPGTADARWASKLPSYSLDNASATLSAVAAAAGQPLVRVSGFCGVTTDGEGGRCLPTDSRGAWRGVAAASLRSCRAACEACARCHYVSFSQRWKDCSWFRRCDELQSGAGIVSGKATHLTSQVRLANGSLVPHAVHLLAPSGGDGDMAMAGSRERTPQPRQQLTKMGVVHGKTMWVERDAWLESAYSAPPRPAPTASPTPAPLVWPTRVVAVVATLNGVRDVSSETWYKNTSTLTFIVYQRTDPTAPNYTPNFAFEAGVIVDFIQTCARLCWCQLAAAAAVTAAKPCARAGTTTTCQTRRSSCTMAPRCTTATGCRGRRAFGRRRRTRRWSSGGWSGRAPTARRSTRATCTMASSSSAAAG